MALLDGRVTCGEHQCPMLDIGGEYRCVFEYTNELIGAQQVIDVIPALEGAPARLVFANGYALPMLCPDCGEPLLIEDADEFLESVAGLYLFALAFVPPSDNTPDGCMEFVFTPSLDEGGEGGELPEASQSLLLHLDSVRNIDLQYEAGDGANESEEVGYPDGQCYTCDRLGPVNDWRLCDDCAAKLDRDLIRKRAWDYAAMAFGVAPQDREKLREQVITQFGEKIELIVTAEDVQPKRMRRWRQRGRRG